MKNRRGVSTEVEKHIPDIYPKELQLNKANTSDKNILSLI